MDGRGKSDGPAVPKTPPNKGGGAPSPAEEAEGRGLAKGSPGQQSKPRTQCRMGAAGEFDSRPGKGRESNHGGRGGRGASV